MRNAVPLQRVPLVYSPPSAASTSSSCSPTRPTGSRSSASARGSTLPKSAAHRLLALLAARGFVRQDDATQHYALTLKLAALGFRFLAGTRLAGPRAARARRAGGAHRRARAPRGRRRRHADLGRQGAGRAVRACATTPTPGRDVDPARHRHRQGLARVAARGARAGARRARGAARHARASARARCDARRAQARAARSRAAAAMAKRSRKASRAWPPSPRRARRAATRRAASSPPSALPVRSRGMDAARRAALRARRARARRRADRAVAGAACDRRRARRLTTRDGHRRPPPATTARARSRDRCRAFARTSATDARWNREGLRADSEYRDLGLAAATGGRIGVKHIRALEAVARSRPAGTGTT